MTPDSDKSYRWLHHHPWQCVEAAVSDATRAIYPDVVWLAAHSLREHSTSHREAS